MNADEKRTKKIPLDPPLQMCVERGMALQINAWYDYTLSSIITAASNDSGEVSLTVTNLSTGETWYDTLTFNPGSSFTIRRPDFAVIGGEWPEVSEESHLEYEYTKLGYYAVVFPDDNCFSVE